MLRHAAFFIGTASLVIVAWTLAYRGYPLGALVALAAANLWVYIDERWK